MSSRSPNSRTLIGVGANVNAAKVLTGLDGFEELPDAVDERPVALVGDERPADNLLGVEQVTVKADSDGTGGRTMSSKGRGVASVSKLGLCSARWRVLGDDPRGCRVDGRRIRKEGLVLSMSSLLFLVVVVVVIVVVVVVDSTQVGRVVAKLSTSAAVEAHVQRAYTRVTRSQRLTARRPRRARLRQTTVIGVALGAGAACSTPARSTSRACLARAAFW